MSILPERQCIIYALCEPTTSNPRYVGKTIQTVKRRLARHRYDAKRDGHLPVHRWLNKTPNAQVIILEIVSPSEKWEVREAFWIEKGKAENWKLLNLTAGGEGGHGYKWTDEQLARKSVALRRGAHFSCRNCTATFWRRPSDIKQGNNKFCSTACYLKSQKGKSKPVSEKCRRNGLIGAARWRKSKESCPKGHPYSGTNLYISPRGSRVCRTCTNGYKRAKRKEASGNV